jgi:hypothetical protein
VKSEGGKNYFLLEKQGDSERPRRCLVFAAGIFRTVHEKISDKTGSAELLSDAVEIGLPIEAEDPYQSNPHQPSPYQPKMRTETPSAAKQPCFGFETVAFFPKHAVCENK